jgi:hypothetical protein
MPEEFYMTRWILILLVMIQMTTVAGMTEEVQTQTANFPVVVQNQYFAKPGKADEVYRWRIHASDVREKLGLRRGRVLRRIGTSANQPDVIWECDYPDMQNRDAEVKVLDHSPEFDAVMEHMGTLIDRFDRSLWQVGQD